MKQLQHQGFKLSFKQPENHIHKMKTDNHYPSESNHEQIDSQAHQTKPKIPDFNGRDQNLNGKKVVSQTLINNQTSSAIQNEQL